MGIPVDKVDLMSVFVLVTFLDFKWILSKINFFLDFHANSNFLQFNSLDFVFSVFLTINISEKKISASQSRRLYTLENKKLRESKRSKRNKSKDKKNHTRRLLAE